VNVPTLSELYVLSCLLNGVRISLRAFFARQLYTVASRTKGWIVIREFIRTIARFFNIIPEDDDRVPVYERLDKASFELNVFLIACVGFTLGVGLCLYLM